MSGLSPGTGKRDASMLPPELVDAFLRHDVVLFCGDRLSRLGGFPTRRDLARFLALRIEDYDGYKHGLADVAATYEAIRGRHNLINVLLSLFRSIPESPTQTHKRISGLELPAIVTTCWDGLLETAVRRADAPFSVVIDDRQLPFTDPRGGLLVKIYGSIERPESLVVTERDHHGLAHTRPGVLELVTSFFRSRTLLFLGFDLLAPEFRQLLYDCRFRYGELARPLYVTQPGASAADVQRWRAQGLHLVDIDVDDLISSVVEMREINQTSRQEDS